MYIDNQIKQLRVTWTPHTLHTYRRVSRSKWQIKLNYACGAEMFLENQPDDLIQCLVLGAFNSHKEIKTDTKELAAEDRPGLPITSWKEFQTLLLDEST